MTRVARDEQCTGICDGLSVGVSERDRRGLGGRWVRKRLGEGAMEGLEDKILSVGTDLELWKCLSREMEDGSGFRSRKSLCASG